MSDNTCCSCSYCGKTKAELEESGVELFDSNPGVDPDDIDQKGFVFASKEYDCLCSECLEVLKDEFSDLTHIISDEGEEEFFDHED